MSNVHPTMEASVDLAAKKYFSFFLQDWASKNNLDPGAHQEIIEFLKDSFFFTEAFLEDNDNDEDAVIFEDDFSTPQHRDFE